jgi:hypothetical protein
VPWSREGGNKSLFAVLQVLVANVHENCTAGAKLALSNQSNLFEQGQNEQKNY